MTPRTTCSPAAASSALTKTQCCAFNACRPLPARNATARFSAAAAASRQRAGLAVCAAAATQQAVGAPAVFHYTELQLETKPGIHIVDITPQVARACAQPPASSPFLLLV
jgi:hypothetical protein